MEEELRRIRALHNEAQDQQLDVFVTQNGKGDLGQAILNVASSNPAHLKSLMSTLTLCNPTHTLRSEKLMDVFAVLKEDSNSLASMMYLVHRSLIAYPEQAFVKTLDMCQFINFVAGEIASDDLGVSEASSMVVVETLTRPATDNLLKDLVTGVLSQKLKGFGADSMMQLRYANVLSKITAKSNFHFETCLDCGVVESIVALCQSSDVLLSICAMELLLEISKTPAGLNHLLVHGIGEWLLSLCFQKEGDATHDPILSAQALTTVLDLLTHAVESKHSSASALFLKSGDELPAKVLHAIVGKFDAIDDGGRLSGLLAVSNFATLTEETMRMVVQDAEIISKWLGLLNTAKIEIKAACLHSVAKVVDSDESFPAVTSVLTATGASAVQQMKISLLESMGRIKNQPVVAYLVQISKQPMNELRHASMDVMRSIARGGGGWGLKLLYLSPTASVTGFRAFLENRATEHCREGRMIKFRVIEAVHSNPSFGLLPEDVQRSIQQLVSQGPDYMPSNFVVGTMEAM